MLGPSVVKCAATSVGLAGPIGSAGGAASIPVSAQPECAWTVVSQASWISDVTPVAGQGPGQIQFRAAPNASSSMRQADLLINDVAVRLTQQASACVFTVTPTSIELAAPAAATNIVVSTGSDCAWTVATAASWLTVTGAASRVGPGTVEVQAAENSGGARTGTVTVAGRTVTVQQAPPAVAPPPTPPASCTYAIDPTSRSFGPEGGMDRTTVATADGCAWTAASQAAWIRVAGSTAGSGSGPVVIVVDGNEGVARTGSVTIAGLSLLVTQSASGSPPPSPPPPECTYAVTPTDLAAPAAGGGLSVAVTTPAACAWTATSQAPWLAITGGSSGAGDGAVTFAAAANAGPARAGSLLVAGQTVTVSQASGCAVSINPTNQSFSAAGGSGTPIAVTAPSGCAWTATTADGWIAITSGASGTANGTVNFTVAGSTQAARTGTIQVGGNVFTVSQASGCAYAATPLSFEVAESGSAALTVTVTSGAGCAWTAVSNTSWITIASGSSGQASGSVVFSVAVNPSGTRNGSLTVAGYTVTVRQTSK